LESINPKARGFEEHRAVAEVDEAGRRIGEN